MKELRQIGWAAEPALRKVLEEKRSLEMRKRVNELLAAIRGTGLPPEVLQLLRGVEVLEHINTATARQLLRKLAESPLPEGLGRDELRQESGIALHRLATHKP